MNIIPHIFRVSSGIGILCIFLGTGTSAFGQDGVNEHVLAGDTSNVPATFDSGSNVGIKSDEAQHGIGLRLRYVFVPKALLEVFMEKAASGVMQPGVGVDYIYRRQDFELSVGVEFDKLNADDGYYVESGGSLLTTGTTDFVEFQDLAWVTLDAAFVWRAQLTDLIALRYGGGIGIGIVTGDILETDATCEESGNRIDCREVENARSEKQDFFRFPPVFNALAGVQLTPGNHIAVNFEIGMRTVFYGGVGIQYFL